MNISIMVLGPKIKKPKLLPNLVIAMTSDGLDYAIIGLIPGLTILIDALTSYLLYRNIGIFGLMGSPEALPIPIPLAEQIIDLLPLHTSGVVVAWSMGVFRKK